MALELFDFFLFFSSSFLFKHFLEEIATITCRHYNVLGINRMAKLLPKKSSKAYFFIQGVQNSD